MSLKPLEPSPGVPIVLAVLNPHRAATIALPKLSRPAHCPLIARSRIIQYGVPALGDIATCFSIGDGQLDELYLEMHNGREQYIDSLFLD